MSVVKKKKHVSKKNKKAWRKYCDIRDVEDFMEDQRLEERLGKFETKPDAELFVVDTGGDEVKVKEERPVTAKLRKRAKLPVTPKCYEVLLPSSKVPDPNAKRNYVNPTGTKPTALSKLKEKRLIEKGVYEKKAELAKKNRKMALDKKRKLKRTRQNFGIDLWGQDLPEAKGIPSTLVNDFVSTEAVLHNVLPDRRLRAKPPLSKTVVARRAIELPHPGVSYNPSFKEHQDLLQQVVQHEEKIMKRGRHLHRVTTGMFSRVTQQENENQWREEMNLNEQPHNPAAADSGSDSEYRAINPPVRNKKKDHKARRKQKERLVEKERLKRQKIDKQKITDLYKLRKLQSNISTKEKSQENLRELRASKRAERAETAAPALNKNKPPQKEPVFVDPADLRGNLTGLSTNSNLLRDRYESLQHRGALAASKLMMKKKRKLKSYFKAGHKVTEQEIEKYTNKKDKK